MKNLYYTLFFIFTNLFVFAQQKFTIDGKISEQQSNIPIPFVNVFLEGTTIGTQTNENGVFTLKNVPRGNYRLVASMVGYESFIQNILVSDKENNLLISLKTDIKALQEVKVVSNRDKVWEKRYKEFERDFLGSNFNKKQVKILNKEVIDFNFDKKTKIFSAKATQPIIVENQTLGYKYTYILNGFEKMLGRLAFKGLGRFELLEPQNDKQKKQWDKNRVSAYKGSLKHFFKTLLYNTLKDAGFTTYYKNNDLSTNSPLFCHFVVPDIIFSTNVNDVFQLKFDKQVGCIYEDAQTPTQYSEIKQIAEIFVNADGDLFDPYSVEVGGAMSKKRVADLLPFDFELIEDENTASAITASNSTKIPSFLKNVLEHTREIIDISGLQDFYLSGETLQFEAFVKESINQNPSPISVPLYVELINLKDGKLVKRFTLKSDAGYASLAYDIPLDFSTGNYQIRAYTNWMRNFSEEAFFHQNFTVFSQNYKKEQPAPIEKIPFDTLQVSVEGGNLIEGLKSRIAIETKNTFGENMSISLQIITDKSDTLLNLETDSTGIVLFDLIPKPKETYKIIAQNKVFNIPQPQTKGTIFTVDNISNKEKLRVFIQNNDISNDVLTFALVSNEQVVYWKSFQNNKPTLLINIPKDYLQGIIHCFLLNSAGRQLAERTIEVLSDEETLRNILANDKKMLTQPPTNFWNYAPSFSFQPEKGLSLKGEITKINGKKAKKDIKLSMILTDIKEDTTQQQAQTFFADVKDQFEFQNIEFFGKKKVTFIAPNNKISLDTTLSIPTIYPKKMPINWHLVKKDDLEKRKDAILTAMLLKEKDNLLLDEVKITAKKIDENIIEGITPNFVLPQERIINQPNLSGIISFLKFSRSNRLNPALIKVFVENQEIRDKEELNNLDAEISPSSVDKILVFENIIPSRYGNAQCVIAIVLRKGAIRKNLKINENYFIEGYYIDN